MRTTATIDDELLAESQAHRRTPSRLPTPSPSWMHSWMHRQPSSSDRRASHWSIFRDLVASHRLRGNDVPDAYLAAIALEAGATMATLDRGFARFAGLRLADPLA
jgi:hypothetical protein